MIDLIWEDMSRMQRVLRHIPERVPTAAASAINRAAQSARTEAARGAREEYIIKYGEVLRTINIYPASTGDLNAKVISRGSVIPLAKFKITPKKQNPKNRKVITATVKRGQGGALPQAFTAGMGNGFGGVFERVGAARFPIKQLYGPSVPQMIGSPTVSAQVEQKAVETLDKRIEHEIERALGGL